MVFEKAWSESRQELSTTETPVATAGSNEVEGARGSLGSSRVLGFPRLAPSSRNLSFEEKFIVHRGVYESD